MNSEGLESRSGLPRFPRWTQALNRLLDDLRKRNLKFGAAGLPVEFRKDSGTFNNSLRKLPAAATVLQKSRGRFGLARGSCRAATISPICRISASMQIGYANARKSSSGPRTKTWVGICVSANSVAKPEASFCSYAERDERIDGCDWGTGIWVFNSTAGTGFECGGDGQRPSDPAWRGCNHHRFE